MNNVVKGGHHCFTNGIRTMPKEHLYTFVLWSIVSELTMTKLGFVLFSVFASAIAVDPYHRHIVVSPHSSSEIFYTGGERQLLASAPVGEVQSAVAAPATPVGAVAAPPIAFSGSPGFLAAAPAPLSAAVAAPVAAPVAGEVAVPPVAPVVAKVAQFKLSYPQYAYGYSVQDFTTGDNKVAKEVREGGVVKGSYSVADPDGTKRTVNYYADPIHGFNAVVHKTQILK